MNQLNLRRILFLIRNEWTVKWRIYSIILGLGLLLCIVNYSIGGNSIGQLMNGLLGINQQGTVLLPGGTITTFSISESNNEVLQKYHLNWFPEFYLILMCLIASLSFWEYREGSTQNFHISLPAQKLEKWIAKYIFAILLAPLFILLAYQAYARATYALSFANGRKLVDLGLFDPYLWSHVIRGFIFSTVIFIGATFLRSYSILKLAIIGLVFYLSYNILTNVILGSGLEHINLNLLTLMGDSDGYLTQGSPSRYDPLPKDILMPRWLSYKLLTVILLILGLLASYYRFKESEA